MMLRILILLIFCNIQKIADAQKKKDSSFNLKKPKTYCEPKILGSAPYRILGVGYDYVMKHDLKLSAMGIYDKDSKPNQNIYNQKYSGLRLNFNMPIINRKKLVWQVGYGMIRHVYGIEKKQVQDYNRIDSLGIHGLKSTFINTTAFIPLNSNTYIMSQIQGELNRNNGNGKTSINNTRMSASVLWGKRPHPNLMWGIGISRNYRGGELNYLPVIMYNWSSKNLKWASDIILPSRGLIRYRTSDISFLISGFEIEGGSYRMYNIWNSNMELRRSELRLRLEYQRQLITPIWISIQMGLRSNINYNVDILDSKNKDFFRGFWGKQHYKMLNSQAMAPFFNVSLLLVKI